MTDMPNHPPAAHYGPRRVLDSSTTDRLMVEINPIRLAGPWHEGFSLDFHTVGSQLLGYDAYGNPQFETTRTPIGELLYKLKYRSDRSTVEALCQTAAEFVEDRGWDLNLIAPVPPSRSGRRFQPVPVLAKEIGRLLGWPSCPDCIIKTRVTDQLKAIYDYQERLDQLTDAYSVTTDKVMNQNVLLIDDVYRSGATLEAVANVVRHVGRAKKVFALAFTRTRRSMRKVFIGGSRRLGRLNPQVKSRAENMIAEGLQILVGDANGADKAIQGFFSERGYDNVVVFYAGAVCRNNLGHWSTREIKVDRARRDFRFFAAKDIAMSDEADYGFMIWDGESQGTVNNVLNLLERGKKVVVYLSPDREFIVLRSPSDATELLKRIDRELADVLDNKVGLRRRVAASQMRLT